MKKLQCWEKWAIPLIEKENFSVDCYHLDVILAKHFAIVRQITQRR
jgi:hypothetical protein